MENIKLDVAMCLDCDWQGKTSECDTDIDEDEFWGRLLTYPICPECGGAVELSNSEYGDLPKEFYNKNEQ